MNASDRPPLPRERALLDAALAIQRGEPIVDLDQAQRDFIALAVRLAVEQELRRNHRSMNALRAVYAERYQLLGLKRKNAILAVVDPGLTGKARERMEKAISRALERRRATKSR